MSTRDLRGFAPRRPPSARRRGEAGAERRDYIDDLNPALIQSALFTPSGGFTFSGG